MMLLVRKGIAQTWNSTICQSVVRTWNAPSRQGLTLPIRGARRSGDERDAGPGPGRDGEPCEHQAVMNSLQFWTMYSFSSITAFQHAKWLIRS